MLEITILVCFVAIFIILSVRFPKTEDFLFFRKKEEKDDIAIREAKMILDQRHIKNGVEAISQEEEPVTIEPVDELDCYDKELSALLKLAREKINEGKFSSAEGFLIDAICRDSKCAWAYERLGSIYLEMGKNFQDAEESFSTALKIDRNNDKSWYGLGQIYFLQGQISKAINCYSKAVNILRADAHYQAALGRAYMEVRQYGKAAKALKRASSLDISNQEYKNLASLAEDKHREHSRVSKLS